MHSDAETEGLLFALLDQFVIRHNNQDLMGVLQLYHRSSFVFDATEKVMMRVFKSHNIAIRVNDRRFITKDANYAYLRASMTTLVLGDGPASRSNTVENLIIFKCVDDRWGIWCQFPIEMQAPAAA